MLELSVGNGARRLVVGCVLIAIGAGCASTLRRFAADEGPLRMVAAPVSLTALPPKATYAWVAPTTVFAGVTATDDSAALRTDMGSLRESSAAVLRANGWRESAEDMTQYRLALVRVEREAERVTMVPDPRNDRRLPPRCPRGAVPDVRNPCVEHPPPNYPPIRRVERFADRRVGYAIVRASDGATRWWILNGNDQPQVERWLARWTLELLLAEAR